MFVQGNDDFAVTVSHKVELAGQLSSIILVVIQLTIYNGMNTVIVKWLVSTGAEIDDRQPNMAKTCQQDLSIDSHLTSCVRREDLPTWWLSLNQDPRASGPR